MCGTTSLIIYCVLLCMTCVQIASTERCEAVKKVCMSRIGCGMALHNFLIGCGENLGADMETCTTGCKRALVSLLSSEDDEGLKFINCECSKNDTYCILQKSRIEVCTNDVLPVLDKMNDPTSVLSCTLAKWICEADSSCLEALQYYETLCGSLFLGNKCTDRCNNSVAILHDQEKAKKLRTCKCDGTENFNCPGVKYYTDALCFNKTNSYRVHGSATNSHISPFLYLITLMVSFCMWRNNITYIMWDDYGKFRN